MGQASAAIAAIGGVIAAYGSYQQGKAQEYAAEHNAQVARNQAKATEEEARENSKRQRGNNERMLATMRANLASQGTGLSDGSSLAILGETASELELSVLDNYRSAESQRSSLLNQASTEIWQGKEAKRAGTINAFSGLLGTAGKAAGNYVDGVNSGAYKPSFLYRGWK
tara:strand:+ start:1563 stop:2069 length:507 start_codon:yes stop_codon:yes gene_type:complete